MFFPDVLKFFNRLGVRQVNDVTAHVTAGVTAGMDPQGMGAHMGDGLQVVQAVPFDQSVLLSAITESRLVLSADIKGFKQQVVVHLDKGLKKECDARKKGIKDEGMARKKAIKDIKDALRAQNELLEKRLQLLEQGAESNKRPRETSNACYRPLKNIISNKTKDSFGWTKMVKGVCKSGKGFATAEEARLDMARFYAAAVLGASAGGSARG